MTRPWKVVASAMAVFGFVYGYTGAAGHDCSSMGQCLKDVADRGLAGFAPDALIPGAIGAVVFAAFVYLLFLPVYGIRRAFGRQPSTRDPKSPAALGPQPSTRALKAPAAQSGPDAGQLQRKWVRPTPLLLALGAALAWAVLSVGPASLADSVGALVPQNAITAPIARCPLLDRAGLPWYVLEGSRCVRRPTPLTELESYAGATPRPIEYAEPVLYCGGGVPGLPVLPGHAVVMEADGMCHQRSGGTIEPLVNDLLDAGKNGLLAFLAVGAALLLWPKLRAGGSRV